MHRKTLSIVISFCTVIFAVLAWWGIQRAILIAGSSKWIMPIVFFSLFFVFFCLVIILVERAIFVNSVLLLIFLTNFLFVLNFWQLLWISLGILVVLSGIRTIRSDLKLNIRLDVWKSLHTGRGLLIVGLAILISSQYYFTIQKKDGQRIMPNLETGELTGKLSSKIIATLNPNFKALEKEGITVDEFILQTQQNQSQGLGPLNIEAESDRIIDEQFGTSIPQAQRDVLKKQARDRVFQAQQELSEGNNQMILTEGRRQLALMAGKELAGDEKMTEVLSGFVDKKINDYFSPRIDEPEGSNLLPLVMSGVLFFTIWPLGSFLAIAWILSANLLFKAFVRLHLIGIREVTVEMEVIA